MEHLTTLAFFLIIMLPLFWMMSRQKKRQRELQAMRNELKPGQVVMTGAGLYARVVSIQDDTIVLASASGEEQTWASGAVLRVLTQEEAAVLPGLGSDIVLNTDELLKPSDESTSTASEPESGTSAR